MKPVSITVMPYDKEDKINPLVSIDKGTIGIGNISLISLKEAVASMSQEDLAHLALQSLTITVAKAVRDIGEMVLAEKVVTVYSKKIVDNVAKATIQLSKLSKDDIAKLLLQYQN